MYRGFFPLSQTRHESGQRVAHLDCRLWVWQPWSRTMANLPKIDRALLFQEFEKRKPCRYIRTKLTIFHVSLLEFPSHLLSQERDQKDRSVAVNTYFLTLTINCIFQLSMQEKMLYIDWGIPFFLWLGKAMGEMKQRNLAESSPLFFHRILPSYCKATIF